MKNNLKIFLILSAGFIFTTGLAWSQAGWPTFQYNNQRTGRCPYVGPSTPESTWAFTTGGDVEWSSPVISEDGTIYFGCKDGNFYAVNPDASLKWTYTTGGEILSAPAIGSDGALYFGCDDMNLYAIEDSVTYGKLRWTYSLPVYPVRNPILVGPDQTVYASGIDIYAIDPTGNLKWTYDIYIGDIGAGAALSHDATSLYTQHATDLNYYLSSIDTSGAVNWERVVGSAPYSFSCSTPTIGSDNTIYYPVFGGTIYALNPNGTYKWTSPSLGIFFFVSPCIGKGDTIYMAEFGDGDFCAISPEGNPAWTVSFGGDVRTSPIVDDSGTIYTGFDNTLYAVNPDGSIKWQFDTGTQIYTSPAMNAAGTIYFCSGNNLYAIERTAGISSDEYQTKRPGRELLLDVCPNPFCKTTNIKLRIPETVKQSSMYKPGLAIYDVTGQLIRSIPIFSNGLPAANIVWDGKDNKGLPVPSGTYIVTFQTGEKKCKSTVIIKLK